MSTDQPDQPSAEKQEQRETLSEPSFEARSITASEKSLIKVGHYRILHKLGEGGMGEVYEAEQFDPVKRKVALKLIKRGMDSKLVLSRFELERQALAVMAHVNIAQIFDGGISEQGQPYFVMEYVEGIPINKYCDEGCLNTRQRLKLFMQVCAGIQHAHQKGIIHRDIKPSNVLVKIQDEKPVPKIIDFGVAKATAQGSEDETAFTQIGQIIGTPLYMSPEQISGQDVDTRTDVYSLGVLLYELLAGVHPLKGKDRAERRIEEMLRRILNENPSRPSVQVSSAGGERIQVAKQRRTDPISLARELRGDLDWITMKALEKERERRYNSPSELAADIRRCLNNEPVLASPPGKAYLLHKFVRRHRIGVAAGVAVFLALLAGITGTTIGMMRAIKAEKTAKEEAENALISQKTTSEVSEFLVGLFRISDPSETRGNTVTAREILDNGAAKIPVELKDQPRVQATLMNTIGNVYASLGLYNQAAPLLEEALAKRRALYGNEHQEVADSLNNLGALMSYQGNNLGAEQMYRESLTLRQKLVGNESEVIAESLNNLANALFEQGKLTEAEQMMRKSLAMYRKLKGETHQDVATLESNLALFLSEKGDYEEAEKLYRQSLSTCRSVLDEQHPALAVSLNNLGMHLYRIKNYKEAEPFLKEALDVNRRVLGDEHPEVASNMNNLGLLYRDKGDLDAAEGFFKKSLSLRRKLLENDHPSVSSSLQNLAYLLVKKGEHKEAASLYGEVIKIQRKNFPENHWQIATTKNLLGDCMTAWGKYSEAEPLLVDAYQIIQKQFGNAHPRTQAVLRRIANLYENWGKNQQAEEYRALLAQ